MAVQHLDIIKFVLADVLKQYDVMSPGWLTSIISEYRALFPAAFENFVKSFDFDPSAEENRRVKSFMGHAQSGSGYRCFIHMGQLVNSETFKRYDFGAQENFHRYGQLTPPDFPLHRVSKIPIALYSGSQDMLSDPLDVDWLAEQLGTHRVFLRKNFEDKGHMTWIFGKNMSFFTEDILPLLHKYKETPTLLIE